MAQLAPSGHCLPAEWYEGDVVLVEIYPDLSLPELRPRFEVGSYVGISTSVALLLIGVNPYICLPTSISFSCFVGMLAELHRANKFCTGFIMEHWLSTLYGGIAGTCVVVGLAIPFTTGG